MAIVEFLFVQMEVLESRHALSAVPGIGEQDASYIPEYSLHGQEIIPVGEPIMKSQQ